MAAEGRSPGNSLPNDDVHRRFPTRRCSRRKSFVEAEEGAANRLMGWPGRISTAIAVVMSLFHLYAALRDRSDPGAALHPRRLHAGAELSCCFPLATRFPQPGALVGRRARHLRGGDHRLCAVGRRRFYRPRHLARSLGTSLSASSSSVLLLEATRRTTGPIMPVVSLFLYCLRDARARICRRHGHTPRLRSAPG